MAFEEDNYRKLKRYISHRYSKQNLDKEKIRKCHKAYLVYEEEINILTWLPSFIPGTRAYEIRKNLAEANETLEALVIEDLKNQFSDQPLLQFKNETELLSSPFKAWGMVLLTVLFLAIALTGIGALAGLGIFGSALAGFALAKGALNLCTIILGAAQVNFLSLSIIAGISGYLSSLFFSEWQCPGFLLNLIPYGHPLISKNIKISLDHVFGIFLATNNLLTDEFAEQPSISVANTVAFILNPAQWALNILSFTFIGLARLLEIGTEEGKETPIPQWILKSAIHIIISLVEVPLYPIAWLVSLPFHLVKGIFYDLPVAIHHEVTRPDDKPKSVHQLTSVHQHYPLQPVSSGSLNFIQNYHAQQYGSGYGIAPAPSGGFALNPQPTQQLLYTF